MEQAKVKPYRAVMETGAGDRFTRTFFAEDQDKARTRAQHHADYERHVRFGENAGSVAVIVVAEVAGAPANRRFKDGATISIDSGKKAAEGL